MKLAKKYFLVFLFFHICLIGGATNYYVSNSGNDSNTGLTPDKAWQTLTKVNSVSFKAGDQILFEKGSTFYGTLTIKSSGTAGSPIIYGSYGAGVKPAITGFTTITSGWTNEGGGIYSKAITSESQTNMVVIDGVEYGMGRYPNKENLLTYESFNSNISIADNQLSSTPNWTGAELIKRPNDWVWQRCSITNHSGSTLTYTCSLMNYSGVAGNGYFIQNSLQTLDQFGEWYHDISSGKFYIYFGSSNPDLYSIQVSTKTYCISIGSYNNVTIDGLTLTGAIKDAVYSNSLGSSLVVKNCDISFMGRNGIYINSTNGSIKNNTFTYCNSSAVRGGGSASDTIVNNNISYIGTIIGASESYYNAIMMTGSNNHVISNNIISHVGSDGIMLSGSGVLVKNNFISYSNLILNDGGGIYTTGPYNSGTVIDGNIILNAYGNFQGGNTKLSIAEGIYLDEVSTGVSVINNTCAFNGYSGIKLHKANTCTVNNNICFGNFVGIYLVNSNTTASTLYNNSITKNQFIALTNDQSAFIVRDVHDKTPNYGTSDKNFFDRPITGLSENTIQANYGSWMYFTLSSWKNYSANDVNSQKSVVIVSSLSDIRFEYNGTSSYRIINLPYPMIDVTGKKYTSIDTLKPYTSVVLLKDPNPAISYTEHVAICQGASYNGWTTTGTYTRTLKAKSGADSIVTTVLTVNPTYTINEAVTIQSGEKYNGWTKTGTYTRTLSTIAGCDSIIVTNLTVDSVAVKQGEVLPTHFISVWQNQTAITPMTIEVVAATKDDLPLAINDEIALYSGSLCVGSLKLTQPIDSTNKSTFISIPASLNDGSGNGFTNNDTILVKIWDDANHREMVVQRVKYHTDDASWHTTGRYSVNATSVIGFKSYTEYTQSISLVKGYNMMSTFVSADNPDVSAVTKQLTDAGTLVKVQDEYGNSYENWGSYGGWVNNLGIMKSTEGYKVKVDANCTLQVTGRNVVLPLDIPLTAGWNIISFPLKNALDAMSVIQPLIDQNKLIKVQDEAGNSIEDWGAFGGWVNGIGNFTPGKAYKVKVNSSATLTIK